MSGFKSNNTDLDTIFATTDSLTGLIGGSFYGLASSSNPGTLGGSSNAPTGVKYICRPDYYQSIVDMTITSYVNLMVLNNGAIYGVGQQGLGQFGNNTGATTISSPIQCASGMTGFVAISSSQAGTVLAKRNDGSLWGWGSTNASGQLGDGTLVAKSTPILLAGGAQIKSFTTYAASSRFIKQDGTLWSTGVNDSGQLGDGTLTGKSSFTQVGTDNTWKYLPQVAATNVTSQYHSAAIKEDGSLWVWGRNTYGQLGNSTNISASTPIQLAPGTTWKQCALGGISGTGTGYTVMVKSDGTVWGTGQVPIGELGNTTPVSSPVQLLNGTNWAKVYGTISGAVVAIKDNGTIWAIGTNITGTMGLGNTSGSYSSPVQLLYSGIRARSFSSQNTVFCILTNN